MVPPWYHHGTTMVLPWYHRDITMVLPWYYPGTTMVLPWYYHGTTMVLPWYYHGTKLIHQAQRQKWSGSGLGPSTVTCWRFIRSCQIPIGRAQPQKLKSMALPYKTKVWEIKLIEFYVDGIEIGDNPIGDEQRGAQMSVFAIGKQGMAKKRHPANEENGKKH